MWSWKNESNAVMLEFSTDATQFLTQQDYSMTPKKGCQFLEKAHASSNILSPILVESERKGHPVAI
jgi:hypothetical protein